MLFAPRQVACPVEGFHRITGRERAPHNVHTFTKNIILDL